MNQETPETDALEYSPTDIGPCWPIVEHARDLERRLAVAREALAIIYAWNSFPSGGFDRNGIEMTYSIAFGSNGERDYMRNMAIEALAQTAAKQQD